MPDGNEPLLREVLAAQAGMAAQLQEVVRGLATASQDAKEARDLGNRITTILEEQNIIARLAEHRTETRQIISEIRQDFVAANTRIRTEIEGETLRAKTCEGELEKRIEALEATRNKAVGVADFFSWAARVMPWLLAGIAAYAAGAFKGDILK